MIDKYKKKVDSKYYQEIKIEGVESPLSSDGFIYTPYIFYVHTEESLIEHKKFKESYKKHHECCPKCGATSHTSTLVAYVYDVDKPNDYKDLNKCLCVRCNDVHSAHDRVPSKYTLRKEKFKTLLNE